MEGWLKKLKTKIKNEISKEDELINQIEKIRARNNKNWMNILRLAVANAPKQTKIIIQDIGKCDAEINKLTKELAGQNENNFRNS